MQQCPAAGCSRTAASLSGGCQLIQKTAGGADRKVQGTECRLSCLTSLQQGARLCFACGRDADEVRPDIDRTETLAGSPSRPRMLATVVV